MYIKGAYLGPLLAATCEFGSSSHRVPAVRISDSVLYCIAPGHEPGQVKLRLSANGQQYSTDHGDFTYTHVHSVHALSPSSGPVRGGTLLLVEGEGFLDVETLSCKFGDILVPAEYVSSSLVRCASPAIGVDAGTSGEVTTVEVSLNGVDFSGSGLEFVYYEDVTLGKVWPLMGPSSGGHSGIICSPGSSLRVPFVGYNLRISWQWYLQSYFIW